MGVNIFKVPCLGVVKRDCSKLYLTWNPKRWTKKMRTAKRWPTCGLDDKLLPTLLSEVKIVHYCILGKCENKCFGNKITHHLVQITDPYLVRILRLCLLARAVALVVKKWSCMIYFKKVAESSWLLLCDCNQPKLPFAQCTKKKKLICRI